ncbi:DUF6942 family protein [Marinobacter sp. SS21]|uniref:DUF6942 family protein n=1 Tax=Marinobacter sp. SS21 TaxID=2979460 RepID=UPI002330B9D2|nr:hypothetical protein [Marinobacter sp. SS21]MDC0661425.1 hypothetical protein [Marinobacter sp. SS21]
MPHSDCLGASQPRLALYLPHRPNGLPQLEDDLSAQALMATNSNHWRKIVSLLAKIVSPTADDWRQFRDDRLFQHTSLCFAPALSNCADWHWIGGKDNLRRFEGLIHQAQPLTVSASVAIDFNQRLLLTPYPDYRQLSNEVVGHIRAALDRQGFYDDTARWQP